MFAPVWNQDPQKDTLYVCVGPSFSADKELQICAILDVTSGNQQRIDLTRPSSNGFACNSAFPSTNREGTVFTCSICFLISKYQLLLSTMAL